MAWPLSYQLDHRRRKIRISVDRHAAEGFGAGQHDQQSDDNYEEALAKGELDNVMDHLDFSLPRLPLVLQRIFELQKEAAIANNSLAFLHTTGNLCATAMAVSELDQAARKLVLFRGRLHVDKGLVFSVAQDGSVRDRESIGDGAGTNGCSDIHVLLELIAGVFCDDARLKRARIGIERGSDIRNSPVKCVGIGIGGDLDAIAGAHVSDFTLVNVDEYPNRAHVRNGENLGSPCLEQLAGTDESLDNFTADGCQHRNFGSGFRCILFQ